MAHYDEMTCLLYLDGQLDRERAVELSAHVEECADCRALLTSLEGESRVLRGALTEEDESVPARLLSFSPEPKRHEAAPLAWLATLGFAGSGAFTLWTWFVDPWQQQLNQAGFGGDSFLAMLFFGGVFWKGWETMVNLTEILAGITLVILAVALFRRGWRRTPTVAVVLGALACLLVLPATAAAAEIRHDKAGVTVAANEVVKNDLIAAGNSVKIEGTVEGDLIVFCQSLTMNGHVTGDVIAFAQIIRINGQVDGNVRSFSSFGTISGHVAKNVTSFSQSFELAPKAEIAGSLMFFTAAAAYDGRVNRDLMGFFADGHLDGFVGGNALLKGERLTIGSSAEISGKTKYTGQKQPSVSEKAKLGSPIEVIIETRRPDYASPAYYWRQTLRWGAAFILGLVVALLMPGFLKETIREGERFGLSTGVGILTLIVTPVAAVIACITIVGLALGILSLMAWVAVIYVSQVFVGAFLGHKMMGPAATTGAMIGRLAVGLLAIRVAGMLPYVGVFAWSVVVVFGFGVLTLAIIKRTRSEPATI